MNKIVFISYSSSFNNQKLFAEKCSKILAHVGSFEVITNSDPNKLINSTFPKHNITELYTDIRSKKTTKHLSAADYFICFWDGTEITPLIYTANLQKIRSRIIAVETTKVANKEKGEPYDVYIGRGTPWGNPFAIGDDGMTREEAIEKYKEYFNKTYLEDAANHKALLSLKGKTLGCHCKPAACHGDVIASYLNSLDL